MLSISGWGFCSHGFAEDCIKGLSQCKEDVTAPLIKRGYPLQQMLQRRAGNSLLETYKDCNSWCSCCAKIGLEVVAISHGWGCGLQRCWDSRWHCGYYGIAGFEHLSYAYHLCLTNCALCFFCLLPLSGIWECTMLSHTHVVAFIKKLQFCTILANGDLSTSLSIPSLWNISQCILGEHLSIPGPSAGVLLTHQLGKLVNWVNTSGIVFSMWKLRDSPPR